MLRKSTRIRRTLATCACVFVTVIIVKTFKANLPPTMSLHELQDKCMKLSTANRITHEQSAKFNMTRNLLYFMPKSFSFIKNVAKKRAAKRSGKHAKDSTLDTFKEAMSDGDRLTLQLLLKVFHQLLHNRVVYWIYCGSLLGSYRHHGPIPWDDDLDVVIDNDDKAKLFPILSSLEPFFFLDVNALLRWKFYWGASADIRGLPWKWPSIDISFYYQNSSSIWDTDLEYPAFVYSKDDVFPLTTRPYLDVMVPAPSNTRRVLEQNFNISECRTNSYDHRRERKTSRMVSVPCGRLWGRFPFVKRETHAWGTMEILQQDNINLQEVAFKMVKRTYSFN